MTARQFATVLPVRRSWFISTRSAAIGLAWTTATNASVAIALSPLVSSLMAALMLRERIGLLRLVVQLAGWCVLDRSVSSKLAGDAGLGDGHGRGIGRPSRSAAS